MIPNHGPSLDFALGDTADAIRETTARFAADVIARFTGARVRFEALDARRWVVEVTP